MAFRCEMFLCVANDLVKGSHNERSIRSSIGRSYYAAYHVAKRYVEANGGSHAMIASLVSSGALRPLGTKKSRSSRVGSHEWVILWLIYNGHTTIGNTLNRLRLLRVDADYNNPTNLLIINRPNARQAIADAAAIIKGIQGLP